MNHASTVQDNLFSDSLFYIIQVTICLLLVLFFRFFFDPLFKVAFWIPF